ncbi:MAG: alpha/beta hydrolase [Candidatus Neomarinimicrobiota bacterium]
MRPVIIMALLLAACTSRPPEVTTGYVDVPGARLYYEQAGSGPPLVLIHGGYLDRRMWDPQFEQFARSHRVVRYDVRAHGLSQGDTVAFADHEDLHRLLAALKIERATIVGLSMGGQIATDFALTYPQMTTALVLVGAGLGGYNFDSDEVTEYVEQLMAALRADDFEAVIEIFTRYWCDGPHRRPEQVDPAVREQVLTMLAGSGQRWQYYDLVKQLDPPAIERLEDIQAPALVVVGSIDMPDIHRIADLFTERIPNTRKVVIENVAHMVSLEKPAEFSRVVLDFLHEQ